MATAINQLTHNLLQLVSKLHSQQSAILWKLP
jgi:hypothetical protein